MRLLEKLFGKNYLEWEEYQLRIHTIEQDYWNTYAQKHGIRTSK